MNIVETLLTPGGKNRPGYKVKSLRAVVLHWIGPFPYQKPENTRAWWEKGEVYGSAHYIIGADGSILRTLPENEVGYHIGSTQIDPTSGKVYTDKARQMFGDDVCKAATNNSYSLGIEMAPISEAGDFSKETLQSAVELCADILSRHGKTVDILTTHHEVVGWKDCPRLWTKNPAIFEEFKDRVKNYMGALNV